MHVHFFLLFYLIDFCFYNTLVLILGLYLLPDLHYMFSAAILLFELKFFAMPFPYMSLFACRLKYRRPTIVFAIVFFCPFPRPCFRLYLPHGCFAYALHYTTLNYTILHTYIGYVDLSS
ncbi:hypothetical protein DFH27DRAFT_106034 [Peziza echinospora]|nr:hypothetical protein DFH27DRAFT_106034 [Peziza echinospora]